MFSAYFGTVLQGRLNPTAMQADRAIPRASGKFSLDVP
jgi:hypothetical protein